MLRDTTPQVSFDSAPSGVQVGLLRVHPTNPIYFTDDSGKAIYLGGHQIFVDLQDNTFGKTVIYNHQVTLDWNWYLGFARDRGINYIRNWSEFSTGCVSCPCIAANPMPYKRIPGYGNANDGGLKFDLNQFDETYFDRMRQRIIDAGQNHMTVSVMLLEVYGFQAGSLWETNVFNIKNNINGVNADRNGDGWGVEFWTAPSSELRSLHRKYVTKVIDTINDLDNVIFELGNEVGEVGGTANWLNDLANFVKSYESGKPKQHLIYMSPGGLGGPQVRRAQSFDRDSCIQDAYEYDYSNSWVSKSLLDSSSADIIAVSDHWGQNYNVDPPVNDTGKPTFMDEDHLGAFAPGAFEHKVPWKAFTRGYHFSLYDHPFEVPSFESPEWERTRRNIGAAVNYANAKFLSLAAMSPSVSISSTKYALANPGAEYLIYQPNSGSFTVDMQSGRYWYEWFEPQRVSVAGTGFYDASSGNNLFTPPFSGDAVLYLRRSSLPAASPSPGSETTFGIDQYCLKRQLRTRYYH